MRARNVAQLRVNQFDISSMVVWLDTTTDGKKIPQGRRSTPYQCYLRLITRWKLVYGREVGVPYLRYAHFHEDFGGKLLKPSDI